MGDDHRRCAALPVPGPRHLARERSRVPELLLRHRRRPERARRHVGQARRGVPRRARRRRLRPAERAELRRDRARDDILPARPLLRPCDRRDPRGGSRADRLRRAQHPLVGSRLRQRTHAGVHERHEPRVLAAHVRRVDHDGPLARPAADRLDGASVRARDSAWPTPTACRCGRASTATGATTPTGSSASAATPISRMRTSSAAPTGSGSRRAATRRAASATSRTRSCAQYCATGEDAPRARRPARDPGPRLPAVGTGRAHLPRSRGRTAATSPAPPTSAAAASRSGFRATTEPDVEVTGITGHRDDRGPRRMDRHGLRRRRLRALDG